MSFKDMETIVIYKMLVINVNPTTFLNRKNCSSIINTNTTSDFVGSNSNLILGLL